MACNPLTSPAGCIVGPVISAIGSATGNSMADTLRDAAVWVMRNTVGWWINVPSIDLASSPATKIRSAVVGVSAVVAVAGLTWAGIRMAFSRKSEAAWDIGTGLMRLAVIAGVGFALPQLLLWFGDSFSNQVLDQAVSGSVADRMARLAQMTGITAPGVIIIAALIMILAGLIQAGLMFLREGGVVILSGVLVLAAAGGFNPATKNWFPKVSGWLLGLALYKPIAALTFASAFYMIGDNDGDPRSVFVGLTMLFLSIVALPVMIKFFSWAAPAAVGATSGLGGVATSLGGAALAGMAVASGPSIQSHASHVRSDLGPVGGGPSGAPMTGTGPTGAGTSSPSPAGGSAAGLAFSPQGAAAVTAITTAAQGLKEAKDSLAQGMTGDDE